MPTAARVVVLPAGSDRLRLESCLLPDPGPDEVVLRILASGLCHSQLHEMRAPRDHDVVLGHEATGRIVAVGDRVAHLRVGDLALLAGIPRTRTGSPGRPAPATVVLPDGRVARSQGVYAWADHVLVHGLFLVKLPESAPPESTSIVGCAVLTGAGAVLHTARVQPGQSVAVFGAGGVGLCAIAAARIVGAHPIVAVDVDARKLAAARRHGATDTVDATREDPVERIRAITAEPGRVDAYGAPVAGAHHVFDCIGRPETARQLLAATRNRPFASDERGQAILVGIPDEPIPVDGADLFVHEKVLMGSLAGSCEPERDVPRLLDWVARGELELEALVTRRYPLERIEEAVSALARGENEGRAILVPGAPSA
ncbi:MAG: zinc-binding dehydrogenase [Spirochaetaceae bacterium]|nr:zinc-binding dehydrogenase [Spirochaetaceae bacterium]